MSDASRRRQRWAFAIFAVANAVNLAFFVTHGRLFSGACAFVGGLLAADWARRLQAARPVSSQGRA